MSYRTVRLAIAGLIAATALAMGGSAHSGNRSDLRGTVFVTERALGSVTALDAETGDALWTAMVGASPIGITAPRRTGKVYTSDEGANRMTVLDRDTGDVIKTISMGPLPHHLMASPDGKYIYVGEFGSNQVGVVATCADVRVGGFVANPLPEARTHAVWITDDGKHLYAANSRINRADIGDVGHIDATTGNWLCSTPVGADPSEILATPDGRTGYVSVRRESRIKELDLTGACPILTGREAILPMVPPDPVGNPLGTQPDTLQLTKDRRTLVVTLRRTPAQIALVDTDTFAVRIVEIPNHTTTGHHWLSANGKYSFVAVESPAGVAVVNNRTGEVVADYPYPNPPGGTRAHGVFFVPRRPR
jgi:DNA-binding beta-propeller fold protein YncE